MEDERNTATPSFWESFRRLTWVQIVFRTVFCIFFQPVAACWQAARDRNSLRPRDKRYAIGDAPNPDRKRNDPANELRVFFGTKERSALRDDLNRQITQSAGTTQPQPSNLNYVSMVPTDARENMLRTIKYKFPSPHFQPAFDAIFSEETEGRLKQLIETELSLPMGNVRYLVRYQINQEGYQRVEKLDASETSDSASGSDEIPIFPEEKDDITLEIDLKGDMLNNERPAPPPTGPGVPSGNIVGKIVVRLTREDAGRCRIRIVSLDAHRK